MMTSYTNSRRNFMKTVGAGCLSAITAPAIHATAGSHTKEKPNIIIIMADDMGFSDIGCYGGEVKTPHIDSLAEDGIRFRQFYNTARCCPTRASLLTGLYSHQAGIGHMVNNKGYPAYQGYLNKQCVTIAEVLKGAGYRTMNTGKWHVGNENPHWPLDRGFDRFYGSNTSTGSYYGVYEDNYNRKLILDDKEIKAPDNWYATDAYTDYALSFIDEARELQQPFFLYLAYTAPHWPLHALPEDIKKYRGRYKQGWDVLRSERYQRMVKMRLVQDSWPLSPRGGTAWNELTEDEKDEMDLRMAVYAAMIDRMDQNIGRLLAHLKKQGVDDNTLILFLSDNGGCAEGGLYGFTRTDAKTGTEDSYTSYGLCWANASNTPFRRYKKWTHEGGIATPLIARWPKRIKKQNGWTDQVGHVIDLMATCCDVADAQYPLTYKGNKIHPMEGKSLLPIFEGKQRQGHDALYWEHEGNKAIRVDHWKLVKKHGDDWELFNLTKDRTEMNNLIKKKPELARQLKSKYSQWAERTGVQPWPVKAKKS